MEGLTLARARAWAAGILAGRGVPGAVLEAEILLGHVLGWPRARVLAELQAPLPPPVWGSLQNLVARRAGGEPLQYLTGVREFMSLEFLVTPDVLIPRPETEVLVETALRRLPPDRAVNAVDVGCGSGAIAVSLAYYRPAWQVSATDMAAPALAVARQNAARHGVQVRFGQGDLLLPLRPAWGTFDLVAANLPYITTGAMAALPPEVRAEPRTALDGGPDGLAVYRRLLPQARQALAGGGALVLEIGWQQGQAARQMLAGWQAVTIIRDYAGRDRVVWAVQP